MAGPDLSLVTAAIDFGSVVSAVVGSFAALVVVVIAWKGAKMVLLSIGVSTPGKLGNYSESLRSDWDLFFGEHRMSREAAEFTMHRARLQGIDEGQLRGIAKRAAKEGRWT